MKKFISLVLVMALVMVMSVSAFAFKEDKKEDKKEDYAKNIENAFNAIFNQEGDSINWNAVWDNLVIIFENLVNLIKDYIGDINWNQTV